MLDTETNKEQKLKEVYHQIEQLQNEKKELQDEKARLTEALALKEEDFVQLQLKVKISSNSPPEKINVGKSGTSSYFSFSWMKVSQS